MGLWETIKTFGRDKKQSEGALTSEAASGVPPALPEVPPTTNALVNMSLRPVLDPKNVQAELAQYPKFWGRYDEFDKFSKTSDIFGIVVDARKREIFRRGIAIKARAGKEATGLPVTEQVMPSKMSDEWAQAEDDFMESFIYQANANGQSMVQVLKEFEDDECTYDDAYLACQFVYEVDKQGRFVGKYAKEFFRLHPANTLILCDKRNRLGRDSEGNKVWFSINDRTKLIKEHQAKAMKYKDVKGVDLVPAHYQFNPAGLSTQGAERVFYAPWEVYHDSEWNRTLTYSNCPPLIRIWMKVWTLVKMDQYVMQHYALQRPPKFFLVFNTTNATSLEKEYNKMIQRATIDPQIPQIMANESKEQAGGVQVVDLMRPLEEMQFIETRQEYRQQIGAIMGVMPIWHADVSTSGGLNNEGMQITVTNRAIEDGQTFYNDGALRFITKSVGIVNKMYELNPAEELDEVANLQRQAMKIQNAAAARNLGLDVAFDKDTGEFTFSGLVKPMSEMPSFGGGNPMEVPKANGSISSGPETGFESNSQPSGTSEEETRQSDAPGFHYPAKSGEKRQANGPEKRELQRLENSTSEKLIAEFNPVLNKLRQLARDDPGAARRELQRLARLLSGRIKDAGDKELRKAYIEGLASVETEFGFPPAFTGNDQAFLNRLYASQVYTEAVSGLRGTIEQAVYNGLAQSLIEHKTFNLDAVKDIIRTVSDAGDAEINQIARTQANKFFTAGRRSGYKRAEEDRGEKFVYDWVGPSDHRETDVCRRIKARIRDHGGAVPWEVLVRIVTQESRKDYPTFEVDPEAPQAHWNERHIPLRKVVYGA